jgi:hypothetical protein
MKKPHRRGTVAEPNHDLSGFTLREVGELYCITEQAISVWDCPRQEDGRLNLRDVIPWRDKKQQEKPSDKADLEKDKLRLQCEKMSIEIEALKAENIPLETHKQIFASRAMSLKNFIQEFFSKNIHLYAHKSVDQLRPMVQEHIAAMLNHFSSNHK